MSENRKHIEKGLSCNRKGKSKGDRLGWKSINNMEKVNLSAILSKGKVVIISKDNDPLLVP